MIQFVTACGELIPTDNQDQVFYLVADGEEIQVAPFQDDDLVKTFAAHKIHVGKGPASCSGFCGNAATLVMCSRLQKEQ